MKHLFMILLFAVLMIPATAMADKLVVGTDCDYAPYSSKDAKGNLVGFEIDLVNEIGRRLNREIEFVCTPFDSAIPSLNTHKYDALFDTLSITPERKEQVDFTIPYRANTGRFGASQDFATPVFDAAGNPNLEGLKGMVIGLQGATVYQDYIAAKFPGIEVRAYDKLPNLYEDLKTGRVNLVIASTSNIWSGLLNMSKDGGNKYKFVGPDIEDAAFGEGVGAAVRKDDPLLKDLNMALQQILEDGTFKTLNQKYFPFTLLPSVWK
jgi:ABC-type amino acid transport substrate-binding protein